MDYLVCAYDIENKGFRIDWWRGLRNAVRGLNPINVNTLQDDVDEIGAQFQLVSCNEADLPTVVDKVSTNFVGRQIKVFKLVAEHTRIPGELKSKTVTKDGVLPE